MDGGPFLLIAEYPVITLEQNEFKLSILQLPVGVMSLMGVVLSISYCVKSRLAQLPALLPPAALDQPLPQVTQGRVED